MREKELSDHHGAVCLDFVTVQVQVLQIRAVLECLCKALSAFTLDLVAHKVETSETRRSLDEAMEVFSARVRQLVVAQVDVFEVDRILAERFANYFEVQISDALEEHMLVIARQHDLE